MSTINELLIVAFLLSVTVNIILALMVFSSFLESDGVNQPYEDMQQKKINLSKLFESKGVYFAEPTTPEETFDKSENIGDFISKSQKK